MHRLEELLREAHIASLEMAMTLRMVQAEAGLTAITGHQMFARFDEAQAQITGAIASAAAGHRLALALAPIAGIDPRMYGEGTEPDESAFRPSGQLVDPA